MPIQDHNVQLQHKRKLGNIFLLPLQPASIQAMFAIATAIIDDGRYHPVTVLYKPWRTASELQPQGTELLWLNRSPRPLENPATPESHVDKIKASPKSWTLPFKKYLYTILAKSSHESSPFAFSRLLLEIRELYRSYNQARRIFDQYNPLAVLLSGDRNLGIEAGIIKVARERGVPTIIVPFAYAGSDDVALHVRTNINITSIVNRSDY